MSNLQRTLIILKPDAVQRGLTGQILSRFETKGLKILGCRLEMLSRELVTQHYAEHKGKSFYLGLIDFMTSGPSMLLALEGLDAIVVCRRMMGATQGTEAIPGTIRGDFSQYQSFNLVHGSDSPEAARRELDLFFPKLSDFTSAPSPPRSLDYWFFGPAPEYDGEKTIKAEKALALAKPFLKEN